MPLTEYTANKVLEHLLKRTAWTQPANIYIGLLSNVASKTELASSYAYARVLNNSWPAASAGAVSNDSEVAFTTASGGDWGTVYGIGIYDSATGGELLAYGSLTTPKSVPNGVQAKFPIGDIDFTVAIV